MRDDRDRYKAGDYYITDARTGFKIRSSEARKEWTGAIVHKDAYEDRHPQDFVRGLHDDLSVKNARPPPTVTFIGPKATLIAAEAAAGGTTITVDSSADFAAADRIAVMLETGDRHLATISSITDATSIVLTAALPGASKIGKAVINQTQ